MNARRAGLRALLGRFAIALFASIWLVAGGIGYAIWLANDTIDKGQREDLDLVEAPRGEPANFLIIGSDTREFVDTDLESEQFGDPAEQGGQRSDTMMVVHVDPQTERSIVVSFPRDLWVSIPGEGEAKLNSAYARGGAKLAVETIESNFDITINHYLEVNFATFREVVDGIGTVDLFFPTSAQDQVTGLRVPNPGCVALDAEQALAYVRSRSYEYYDSDGEWKQDPTADIGRIRRQQYFVRSLMDQTVRVAARSPLRAKRLLERTVSKLKFDSQLDLQDIHALYEAFRSTDAGGVEMLTMPGDLDRSADGESILVLRRDDAEPILRKLRALDRDQPKPADKDGDDEVLRNRVIVGVENGSGVQGQAANAADGFSDLGYGRGGAVNADRDDYETTLVRYRTGHRDAAELVASDLVAGGDLVEDDEIEFDVVVVLGRDYVGVAEPEGPVTTAATPTTDSTVSSGPPPNPGSTPGVTVPPSEAGRPLVGCG